MCLTGSNSSGQQLLGEQLSLRLTFFSLLFKQCDLGEENIVSVKERGACMQSYVALSLLHYKTPSQCRQRYVAIDKY